MDESIQGNDGHHVTHLGDQRQDFLIVVFPGEFKGEGGIEDRDDSWVQAA
jgi:hypothetical protein